MGNRLVGSSGVSLATAAASLAVILSLPVLVSAQASPDAAAKTSPVKTHAEKAKPWVLPRTPDGHPDLQGYWSSLSFTPMNRPAKFGNREFLTDQEMTELFKEGVQHEFEFTFDHTAEEPYYDSTVYALGAWQNGIKPNKRTSLVVDPPDGRIPPLTPEARKARGEMKVVAPDDEEARGNVKADGPEDMGIGVRCLTFGGPPILPRKYNSNTQIVQGAGYVLLQGEWDSEVRIIPTDGSAHFSKSLTGWHGDSRGHWDGDTLVVETTNFRPDATFQNADPKTLKITERFTRTDADTIEYRFTVDDPSTWTKPWTAVLPLSRSDGPMFEYACSEGNNAIVNILAGARAADKAAREKQRPADVPVSHNRQN